MRNAAHFRVEHVRRVPRGWHVRTKRAGPHEIRIAYPPGPRRRGAGEVVEILHPKGERNPECTMTAETAEHLAQNPGEELVIFGNPKRRLTIPEQHQAKIALQTLKMPDAMVGVMGGPTKKQARAFLRSIGVKNPTRFEALERELAAGGYARDPAAVAAAIGRRKYGKRRFQEMAAAGRRAARQPAGTTGWGDLYDSIRHGSRVTFVDRQGKRRTGRAVMLGPGGWVLNMGGAHGTPQVVHPDSVLRVSNPFDVPSFSWHETAEALGGAFDTRATKVWEKGFAAGHSGAPSEPSGPYEGQYLLGYRAGQVARKSGNRRRNREGESRVFDISKREGIESAEKYKETLENKYEKVTVTPVGLSRVRIEGSNKGGRNQSPETDQAVQLYQAFHGDDPERVTTEQRSAAMREDYTALGPLLGVGIYTPGLPIPKPENWNRYSNITFRNDEVMLASNAEGTQLYAIGGNQDLDQCLGQFKNLDTSKDLMELGEVAFVVYLDRKPPAFDPTEYMHEFSSPLPVLGYDKLKREIFFVGGKYSVKGLWLEN
jgi:hypothetical protein